MVWSRDEERRRARGGEESDDERDSRKKEESETEDRTGGCVQTRHADCGTESGRGRRRETGRTGGQGSTTPTGDPR